jgi:uncharacterized OB-fold protein
MLKKKLSEVLHAVDPDLRVVEARPWAKNRRRASQADWIKADGVHCGNCGKEVFKSHDGLCMNCWNNENEFEIRDKAGVLNMLPKEVIMLIVRPARKEETED